MGCGAKTGLSEPDAAMDAFVPEEMDAGVPPTCIEVPPDAGTVTAAFTVPVSLAVVDVFFLIDATASMEDEIDNVRERLRTLVVPRVRAAIPDAAFGVALVGEFPEEPHGPSDVSPYEMRSPITREIVTVEGALDDVPSWGNFDDPEAQVEGLYQVATGEGLGDYIPPSFGCPRGGSGGACFRGESLPLIVLITDAPFHNGPGGANPYEHPALTGTTHTFDQAVDALTSRNILVIGLGARDVGRDSPMPHLHAIAEATGAVDEEGNELAFDIGARGDGVGDGIVAAIERLAAGLPLDVDAIVEDVGRDAIDARTLVTEIRPVSADPAGGIAGIEDGAFVGVVPGTRVTFEIVVDVSGLPASESTRRIPARIIFRAFGRSHVGREDIVILIPGLDGGSCEMEGA